MRNVIVNVPGMTPPTGATQLKGVTFVKIGIVDNFPEYA